MQYYMDEIDKKWKSELGGPPLDEEKISELSGKDLNKKFVKLKNDHYGFNRYQMHKYNYIDIADLKLHIGKDYYFVYYKDGPCSTFRLISEKDIVNKGILKNFKDDNHSIKIFLDEFISNGIKGCRSEGEEIDRLRWETWFNMLTPEQKLYYELDESDDGT